MPAILHRLVNQLKAKWKSDSAAWAIATAALQRSGDLKKWTQKATKKWAKRWKMTPAQRAKIRASKYSWMPMWMYGYNKKANRAMLKHRSLNHPMNKMD